MGKRSIRKEQCCSHELLYDNASRRKGEAGLFFCEIGCYLARGAIRFEEVSCHAQRTPTGGE